VGDYMGLGAAPGTFYPFIGRATGTPAAPASDIYAGRAN
jgi:hypothetical protein